MLAALPAAQTLQGCGSVVPQTIAAAAAAIATLVARFRRTWNAGSVTPDLFTRSLAGMHLPSSWRRRLSDAAIVATPLVVGGISGLLTSGSIRGWYRTLERPDWNPPDWVFGPVWTTLYAMMGVALVKVVRTQAPSDQRTVALAFFAVQLALNFGWSWIFFVQHDLGLALAEIIALWLAIAATAAAFGRIQSTAGALLLPYLAWVTFASVLTATIWQLNR
jgi:tryptophan-rich sensory protein